MDPETDPIRSSDEGHADEQVEQPTAAHFREAARLAAARVRSTLSDRNRDHANDNAPVDAAPDAAMIEDEAIRKARAVRNDEPRHDVIAEPETVGGKGKKATAKALNAANEKAVNLLPEIDERLETGARMLRAFENQIERLERSAARAEQAGEAGPAPADHVDAEALNAGIAEARKTITALENVNTDSATTANALAGGLETANTIKTLLETTIRELTEEAERRSGEVRQLMNDMEQSIGRMTTLIQRADEIEGAVLQRMERAEETAVRIEEAMSRRLEGALDSAEEVRSIARDGVDTVRTHLARELAMISDALLKQAGPIPPTPERTDAGTAQEPPLIEITPRPEASDRSVGAPSTHPGRISQGTLSIDEAAIKRRTDAH